MAVKITNLQPVPLSELPDITDEKDFWVFASKGKPEDDTLASGKFSLGTLIQQTKDALQLERRISVNMERSTMDMFFGEAMTIYKVEAANISSAKITLQGQQQELPIDTSIGISVPAKSIVTFEVTRQLTDPSAFLFIYAKAKVKSL